MKRKAAFHTLGCKVNAYETEAMEELLQQAGYEIVPFDEKADVYIINTCSVTNIAERKSRQMIHRAKKLNPEAAVAAAGCYVQVDADNLKKDLSVDIIIGNNQKNKVAEIVNAYFDESGSAQCSIVNISENPEYEELEVSTVIEYTRAFVKIQDGCNQFCSYCIIPYARGRIRSRSMDNIMQEIERLAKDGIKEIVLTGIHLSSYGRDIDKESHLIDVIENVSRVKGIERIRLGSLEPRIITEEFMDRLTRIDKVCPHFHLSLQSGCNETLKRMNRHYTAEEYLSSCEMIRKAYKNPAITTDVITGFPQETDEEFSQTKRFLEKVHFYEMHIFKYSRRRGTVADKMPGQVDDSVKAERSRELIELRDRMSTEFRKSMLGQKVNVLTEEEVIIDGKKYVTGFTPEYIKCALEDTGVKINEIVSGTAESFLTDEIMLVKKSLPN